MGKKRKPKVHPFFFLFSIITKKKNALLFFIKKNGYAPPEVEVLSGAGVVHNEATVHTVDDSLAAATAAAAKNAANGIKEERTDAAYRSSPLDFVDSALKGDFYSESSRRKSKNN